jgi:hypothetical protein
MHSLTARTSIKLIAVAGVLAVAVPVASAASARKDSGTAYVSVTHQEGSTVWVAGDITDKVLGRGAIVYQTKLSAGTQTGSVLVTAKTVTLYTATGSLTGTGQATQTAGADGSITVTDGVVSLTKGTGALKGHSLKATFSGPFKDNIYTFKYSGTYK